MTIKAIDTVYNGYKFRSRLEARWAVFFDTLGIKYEYEKEGYDLDGTWYLPDFWLPGLKLWCEIKDELTWETRQNKQFTYEESPELELCEKLRDSQKWPVACIVGTPGTEDIHFFGWDITDSGGGSYYSNGWQWCIADGVATIHARRGGSDRSFMSDNLVGIFMPWFCANHRNWCDRTQIEQSYNAAKQARFEHGENGCPASRRRVVNTIFIHGGSLTSSTCPDCKLPVYLTDYNVRLNRTDMRQHECPAGV